MNSRRTASIALAGLLVAGLIVLLESGRARGASNDAFDLPAFVDSSLAAGAKRIVVPPGRYRVTPQQGQHLLFKNLADVEIVADSVEMVCTQAARGIVFEDCRNVRLSGLTVDYDPLPFTEGRITALGPDKSWAEFEILDGYPADPAVDRIEIYDPGTLELHRSDALWDNSFEPAAEHRFRIAKRTGYHYDPARDVEAVGDVLVTRAGTPEPGAHAVSLLRCTGVRLEHLTLYASPLFGFNELECSGTTYDHCRIDRRSPQDDPVRRAFPRLRSLDADAFHSTGATQGPTIVNCTARYQGDDCVNIHGTYHVILGAHGRRMRIVVPDRITLEAGDSVEFLPFHGARPRDAEVQTIEPDGPLTDPERTLIQGLHIQAGVRDRLLSDHAKMYRLTLNREVALPPGSAISATNRTGSGFMIQGCDFGHNRSRGLLIKASHGKVIDNRIARTWSPAVLVTPEFYWLESGTSVDVVIQGNSILGCHATAIEVRASGGDGQPLAEGAHTDIAIGDNTIADSPSPTIHVTSAGSRPVR